MANDRDARGDLGVWLGEELRCARLAAGYTSQDQFARELGFDRTVIVKAETGARPPSDDMAARIAEMFPDLCNGLYVRLAGIARKSNGPIPGWFADWVEIEAKATILRWWEPLLIPGLLQTEDYARAVLSTWRRDNPDSRGGETMNGSDGPRWRKSTFSGANGGGCVEVAGHDGMILVRDTKDHGRGPVHRYTPDEWRAFIARRAQRRVRPGRVGSPAVGGVRADCRCWSVTKGGGGWRIPVRMFG